MNIIKTTWVITIIFFASLTACQKNLDLTTNADKFSMVFSNGTKIQESDILYYDLSNHMLFLKKGIDLNGITSFKTMVNADTIYHGIIQPIYFSSTPKQPIFILDQSLYGDDIIQIGCTTDSLDQRSDPRIINALSENNLLHLGLRCSIDSIHVTPYTDYSKVTCSITITNDDQFNFYILDPLKMGDLKFNYYTNGLVFKNNETNTYFFLRWTVFTDWNNLSFGELSMLKSGKNIHYTFESSDYNRMDKGEYEVYFNFCGITHDLSNFTLKQPDGRIWIGYARSGPSIIHVN